MTFSLSSLRLRVGKSELISVQLTRWRKCWINTKATSVTVWSHSSDSLHFTSQLSMLMSNWVSRWASIWLRLGPTPTSKTPMSKLCFSTAAEMENVNYLSTWSNRESNSMIKIFTDKPQSSMWQARIVWICWTSLHQKVVRLKCSDQPRRQVGQTNSSLLRS